MGCVFGAVVKVLLKTLESHIGVPGFLPHLQVLTPASCLGRPWRAAGDDSSRSLPLAWDTRIEFPALGFCWVQFQPLWALGE